MQRLTSYKVSIGTDGSRCTYVNWYEEAPRIEITPDGHVRFYDKLKYSIHDCKKVYIPEQGEHLEVTGVDDLAAEEFQRYRELWAKFK